MHSSCASEEDIVYRDKTLAESAKRDVSTLSHSRTHTLTHQHAHTPLLQDLDDTLDKTLGNIQERISALEMSLAEAQQSPSSGLEACAPAGAAHPSARILSIPAGSHTIQCWYPESLLESAPCPPKAYLELDHVFGFESDSNHQRMQLLPTGELAYIVANFVVLYSPSTRVQRHYFGHDSAVSW
jgi:hypothetical protein